MVAVPVYNIAVFPPETRSHHIEAPFRWFPGSISSTVSYHQPTSWRFQTHKVTREDHLIVSSMGQDGSPRVHQSVKSIL